MRNVGHFIGGKHVAGKSGRTADIFQPLDGTVQALWHSPRKMKYVQRSEKRQGGSASMGCNQPAAPRSHSAQVP